MHLEVQRARHWVLPRLRRPRPSAAQRSKERGHTHGREHLDLILRPRGEPIEGELLPLTLDRQAGAVRRGRRHPHIWVRGIAHAGANGDTLQCVGEYVEHGPARNECGRAERDGELVVRAVVVTADLLRAPRHAHRIQRRHLRREEVVQCRVDVPAVEARRAALLILGRDDSLVEGAVRWVLERGGVEALVVVHGAVTDQLHLRYAGDRLEVMQDGRFGRLRLVVAMSIRLRRWVECLGRWASALGQSDDGPVAVARILTYPCQGILSFWRKVCVSEKKSVVLEGDKIRD